MTLADFITGLEALANEAVKDRFITEANHIFFINRAEERIAKETGYFIKTQSVSAGEYISSISSLARWFDYPTDYLRTSSEPLAMMGATLDVRVFEETQDNWYSRQLRPINDFYTEGDDSTYDGIIVLYTAYPAGNRKIFTRYDGARRLSGASGIIWSMFPDVVSGDNIQITYVAKPPTHLSIGESIIAPDIYIAAMMDLCLADIKHKAEEDQMGFLYEQKGIAAANDEMEKADPATNRPRRAYCNKYNHPWR